MGIVFLDEVADFLNLFFRNMQHRKRTCNGCITTTFGFEPCLALFFSPCHSDSTQGRVQVVNVRSYLAGQIFRGPHRAASTCYVWGHCHLGICQVFARTNVMQKMRCTGFWQSFAAVQEKAATGLSGKNCRCKSGLKICGDRQLADFYSSFMCLSLPGLIFRSLLL